MLGHKIESPWSASGGKLHQGPWDWVDPDRENPSFLYHPRYCFARQDQVIYLKEGGVLASPSRLKIRIVMSGKLKCRST
jgi:hypothetical protein